MKNICLLLAVLLLNLPADGARRAPRKLSLGTSSGIFGPVDQWTADNFAKARADGIDYIEISASKLLMDRRDTTDAMVEERCRAVKAALDEAGMKIWSIHMPFGQYIDISESDEEVRTRTVELHKRLLRFVRILSPRIVLFHPSWYLRRDERPQRIESLVRSVEELLPEVRRTGATMVIENMLGYELLRDEARERPLNRTVEETLHIMSQLPRKVYAAVDTNHIDNPEQLISALGRRVKTVHISDGDGRHECHDLPWSGRGDNDWNAVLHALDRDARYKGVFMYEVNKVTPGQLRECYEKMYAEYARQAGR